MANYLHSIKYFSLPVCTLLLTTFFWHNAIASEQVSLFDLYNAAIESNVNGEITDDLLIAESKDNQAVNYALRSFFAAEALRRSSKIKPALSAYIDLINWAAKDTLKDKWGGSFIVFAAAWRTLSIWSDENNQPDIETFLSFSKNIRQLLDQRFAYSFAEQSILPTVPYLEEGIRRQLLLAGVKVGIKPEQRDRLVLAYLKKMSVNATSPEVKKILQQVVSDGFISPETLDIMRAKRLVRQKRLEKAELFARSAAKSDDLTISAEGEFVLSQILHSQLRNCSEVVSHLDKALEYSTIPSLTTQIRFSRAMWLRSSSCDIKDIDEFILELKNIIAEDPTGEYTDNALWKLGRFYEDQEQNDRALEYYQLLQELPPDNNNFIARSRIRPALLLYNRNNADDLNNALIYLRSFIEIRPDGLTVLLAKFWIGRILEEQGKENAAKSVFKDIIAQAPYDYYGIRSRMHLALGKAASYQFHLDPQTRNEFYRDRLHAVVSSLVPDKSPYYNRLSEAITSGIYQEALKSLAVHSQAFPAVSISNTSLNDLDEQNLFTPLLTLLTLREDAQAAVDIHPTPTNTLAVTEKLSTVGDYAAALELASAKNLPASDQRTLQKEGGVYLATTFPLVYGSEIMQSAKKWQVDPQLLYAIMYNESHFENNAVSRRTAFGLFQFIAPTFCGLAKKWHILYGECTDTRRIAYLRNPEKCIDFGARWLSNRLLKKFDNDIPRAIMAHNGGMGSVRKWTRRWKRINRLNDKEYLVETAGYAETRIFTRKVITAYYLGQSLFEKQSKK